ncbi:MAG TPA: helix-turn-helix domain-containing protein [Streptosporangiaceae bacterium]
MGEQADAKDAKAALSAAIRSALPEMITTAVDAIWSQVPAYASSTDSQLRENATAHVAAVFEVFLAGLTEDRPPRRSDFAFTRQQASRRISQGISLADYLQAFRVGQLTLWRGVLDAAQADPPAREAALLLVERIMHVIELGSTVAAEAYVEAQQHQLAEHDRLRRDLIEDLLAYRTTFAGPKRSILRAAGLGPETRLIVASATPTGDAQQTLSAAATAIAGVGRGTGLAAQRQNEIVGVIPLSQADASKAVAGLRRASADPARLAIGVSTVHNGLHEVPEAYAEAQVARDALGTAGGVLALPLLSAFDYLVLREAQTAQRLIRPEVRRFVTEDQAAGSTLITTLVTYAESDLNAKVAAQRLHLHVNTAYYRLEKIAERTGYDLRRLADVVELLIAIRLLGAAPVQPSS